jgi:hypothetical protein
MKNTGVHANGCTMACFWRVVTLHSLLVLSQPSTRYPARQAALLGVLHVNRTRPASTALPRSPCTLLGRTLQPEGPDAGRGAGAAGRDAGAGPGRCPPRPPPPPLPEDRAVARAEGPEPKRLRRQRAMNSANLWLSCWGVWCR